MDWAWHSAGFEASRYGVVLALLPLWCTTMEEVPNRVVDWFL